MPKPAQIRTPGHKARSPSVYIVSVFINTQHGSVIRAGFCSMHMLMHMQKLSSEVVLTFVKVIAVGSSKWSVPHGELFSVPTSDPRDLHMYPGYFSVLCNILMEMGLKYFAYINRIQKFTKRSHEKF